MSIVYLIGAGPGDPGLITVRGMQCLAAADVVLYDHLVHPAAAAPRASRTRKRSTSATRRRSRSSRKRSVICSRKKRARARRSRGSSGAIRSSSTPAAPKALFLHEQGVRFEVVPGVPVGIAVPRTPACRSPTPGGGDTITFIRGYEDEGKAERDIDVDWTSLSRASTARSSAMPVRSSCRTS